MTDNAADMQRGLERALARAARSDDQELASWVRREGGRLLFQLHGLVRLAQLHDPRNDVHQKPAEATASTLDALLAALGAVHVVCLEDQAYINDFRVPVNAAGQQVVTALGAELAGHGLGGLSLHQPLRPGELIALASALAEKGRGDRPRQALAARVSRLPGVELRGAFRFRIGGGEEPRPKALRAALPRAERAAVEALGNLSEGRVPHPLPVRRAVIDLLEGMKADPDRAVALFVSLGDRPPGQRHLLGTASLALLVGARLGLSDPALCDLGVAALMHDVGLARPGDHAVAGLRLLARQRGFHEAKVRRLRAVLEHHRGVASAPGLYGRILRVADDLDTLVFRGPAGEGPLSPASALGRMWAAAGVEYDAEVLAALIQVLGRFPPGTELRLSDGRYAMSLSGGRDEARFECPLVWTWEPGEAVDLARQPALRVEEALPAGPARENRWRICFGAGFDPSRWSPPWRLDGLPAQAPPVDAPPAEASPPPPPRLFAESPPPLSQSSFDIPIARGVPPAAPTAEASPPAAPNAFEALRLAPAGVPDAADTLPPTRDAFAALRSPPAEAPSAFDALRPPPELPPADDFVDPWAEEPTLGQWLIPVNPFAEAPAPTPELLPSVLPDPPVEVEDTDPGVPLHLDPSPPADGPPLEITEPLDAETQGAPDDAADDEDSYWDDFTLSAYLLPEARVAAPRPAPLPDLPPALASADDDPERTSPGGPRPPPPPPDEDDPWADEVTVVMSAREILGRGKGPGEEG